MGMKTPWAEFDSDLWTPLVDPLYVYVLRRGDRVFQSHLKLGYGLADNPARMLAHYKESVRKFETLRDAGTAHLVQVDLARDAESRQLLAAELLAFIDEEMDAGVSSFVERWPRLSNPTSDPDDEPNLPDEWQEALAADGEYLELMAAYGYGA